jgi:hypothetical protein
MVPVFVSEVATQTTAKAATIVPGTFTWTSLRIKGQIPMSKTASETSVREAVGWFSARNL